jgi:hypothetical protein
MSTGRGNLIKRVRDLEKLGARTKRQLPSSMALEEHFGGVENEDNSLASENEED